MYSGNIPTLVETEWLAAHLQDSDLRILDCSVMMEITDKGDRKYSSGKARWEEGHIPGSVFVDFLCGDLGSTCNPAVPLMTPLADFAAAMESFGISDDSQVVLYDNSNHGWAARSTTPRASSYRTGSMPAMWQAVCCLFRILRSDCKPAG